MGENKEICKGKSDVALCNDNTLGNNSHSP